MAEKYLHYKKAQRDPHYQEVVDAAVDYLTTSSSRAFRKDWVLKKAGLKVFEDSIRWDYIKRMIEARTGADTLIPVAAVFFKRNLSMGAHDTRHGVTVPPTQYPLRYMAAGHGKRTAGYVLAHVQNSHFVIAKFDLKRLRAAGTMKALDRTRDMAKRVLPKRQFPRLVARDESDDEAA